ncbi:MAG: metal-sensitive transcriptional regulator [Thermoleophilia bacterium]|nr:metal-sensitive transcriptional regulator [Thermoleophilia bacterium]MDH3725566.1 metal-sensitive transcriptional regulator [Thermoleophilia bacterium]
MATTAQPEATQLVSRLRRAEGQLRGVQRMIEEGAAPEEVLAQLAAVKAAVDRVGLYLLTRGLRSCVEDDDGSCAEQFEDAMATFLRYTTLAR